MNVEPPLPIRMLQPHTIRRRCAYPLAGPTEFEPQARAVLRLEWWRPLKTRLKCRGHTTTRSSELLLAARFFSLHYDLLPVEALLDADPLADAEGAETLVDLAPDALPVWTAVPEGNSTLDTGGVTSSWVQARFDIAGPGKTYVDPESKT
ncbi:hypothetical protein GSI_09342 [Ganoderma sinense ZZ0214-1]|uniref:Uncharacterized protein n=1 Tax=Ganoderma sinense ZZ0214-1 TaxID=1077348 RepID=A0A2G8S6A2_9APHY|nr:hypothetical protein GSI_09342 [Ganoderma sinense ZZ0214-1]